MFRFRRLILVTGGFLLIGLTVALVFMGAFNPSARISIGIWLSTAIAVPLAFILFSASWRLGRSPIATELRTEAQAKERAARALDDASTAEQVRANLEAYVVVRSRLLEIHRQRKELASTGDSIIAQWEELKAAERQLAIARTEIPQKVLLVLEAADTSPKVKSQIYAPRVFGLDVDEVLDALVDRTMKFFDRRKLARAKAAAPEALLETPYDLDLKEES